MQSNIFQEQEVQLSLKQKGPQKTFMPPGKLSEVAYQELKPITWQNKMDMQDNDDSHHLIFQEYTLTEQLVKKREISLMALETHTQDNMLSDALSGEDQFLVHRQYVFTLRIGRKGQKTFQGIINETMI